MRKSLWLIWVVLRGVADAILILNRICCSGSFGQAHHALALAASAATKAGQGQERLGPQGGGMWGPASGPQSYTDFGQAHHALALAASAAAAAGQGATRG